MRSDQDIDLTCFEIGQRRIYVAGRFGAAEVLDANGELAQTVREGTIVLQREDRCGHQDCHLLAVGYCLKCRTHSHFGLAEANVATHQSVHRAGRFHIPLDGLDRLLLVGRIFVFERGLQLVLQVSVSRKCKARRRLSLGVEGDQLAGYILDCLLGSVFQLLPSTRAEFVDFRRLAVARLVTCNAVQRVDIDQQHVAIAIDQLDRLELLAILDRLDQTAETSHAVIDVNHIVAHLQSVQFGNRKALIASDFATQAIAMVAVENLMVGVATHLQSWPHETLVQCQRQG